MTQLSRYVARQADANGFIHYTDEENARWQTLMLRQKEVLPLYAAPVYLEALDRLQLPENYVPQCDEVSERLLDFSGWQVVAVPALIDFSRFFTMLANQQFPAASFLRSQNEMEFLREPDIFHEILGHTPLLTDPGYASFVQAYGVAGCHARPEQRACLARLFWFSVEFGLIRSETDISAFGAGIVSSRTELANAIENADVERRPFDVLDILRTPYRIDILQPVYYVLDNLEQLIELAQTDLIPLVNRARLLGLKTPAFDRTTSYHDAG